jgi:hypothetical protein
MGIISDTIRCSGRRTHEPEADEPEEADFNVVGGLKNRTNEAQDDIPLKAKAAALEQRAR